MKTFDSPGEFALFLKRAAALARAEQAKGLREASEMFAAEARGYIGHYQQEHGPFPEWPKLAETTLEGFTSESGHHFPGKIELGYSPPDNPLLREGDLKDSIRPAHNETHAVVGSDSDVAVWQELGTKKMPARSFLGRAVFVNAQEAAKIVLSAVLTPLIGKTHVPHRRHASASID